MDPQETSLNNFSNSNYFHFEKKKLYLILLALFLIILGATTFYLAFFQRIIDKSCTLDTKICPDGSSVGRIPPTCEFAPCPITQVSPTQSLDETANWKTYTNTNQGFTIKYPASFFITGEHWQEGYLQLSNFDSEVGNGAPNPTRDKGRLAIEIWTFKKDKTQPLKAWIEENKRKHEGDVQVLSQTDLLIDNHEAVKNESIAMGGFVGEIYVNKDSEKVIAITGYVDYLGMKDTFTQILSTFKFTDQTTQSITSPDETSNWQTYDNSKGSYSFKYPADYFKFQQENGSGVYLAPSAGTGGNGPKFLGSTDLWLEVSNETPVDFPANTPKTSVVIGGLPGDKYSSSFPAVAENVTVYNYLGVVQKNNGLYTISLSSWNADTIKQSEKLFDQILSTFKFLN